MYRKNGSVVKEDAIPKHIFLLTACSEDGEENTNSDEIKTKADGPPSSTASPITVTASDTKPTVVSGSTAGGGGGLPIDLSLPITSTYLRRMRAFGAMQAEYAAAAAAKAQGNRNLRRSRSSSSTGMDNRSLVR